jgi:NTP pyrophosphatase (non-canonical NTP hydrolase)
MAQENSDPTLADIKRLLDQFAASRGGKPRREVEAEFGDLLLYLIFLAGKSRIDLMAGANRELSGLARDESIPLDRHA